MEERIFRSSLRKFLEREVEPREDEILEKDDIPHELFKKLGDSGYLGITIPERFGGGEAPFSLLTVFFEEVASVSPGLSASLLSHIGLFILALDSFGTEEQKKKLIPGAVRGEFIGALAATEEEAGSDLSALRTKAEKVKNGFLLNGSKTFICNFSRSRYVIVLARDGEGFTLFIAEKGDGFIPGRRLEKLGLEGSDTGNFFMDNLLVPEDMVLGERGKGLKILFHILRVSRILTSSNCVGLALGALEKVRSFSKERVQFSRKLRDFQGYRMSLSRCYMEVEAGRMLCRLSAEKHERGELSDTESIVTKIYCSEMANRVTDMAVHLMGAYGYSKEFGVEKYLRASRAYTVGEGTTEVLLEQLSRIKNI